MARECLAALPQRRAHVAAVADRALDVAGPLGLEGDLLEAAAWLHDIGYSPPIAVTGFHPLDGARYLRAAGADKRVVNLVAHHSHAVVEAEERGLAKNLLVEFPYDDTLPHDALCYCDMTTGPDGQRMTVQDRLVEIRERYGPDDVVSRFITKAEPVIVETVERIAGRLDASVAQSK
ncbi:HDIG domain-containing protein [Nocardioides guangzhouensis]|uniref:HDIG domain-containing protein n=2 Tax=Nocardioides guangzhouensis TaxID=2497878 RepID=A0A4Q4ZMC9_9ACTN|nr:HDIG domain-containing protein [Nocardioides guangzhouensis]